MNLSNKSLDPDLEKLLERGRFVRRVPDVVRARVLARASRSLGSTELLARPLAAAPHGVRFAIAASVAVAVGAAGAAAALHRRTPPADRTPHAALELASPSAQPNGLLVAPAPLDVPAEAAGGVAPGAKPSRSARALAGESYAAELQLLQRAQAAYASGDLNEALSVIGKHGRRFPNGRLAEEREALRVRSLVGAGQTAEARRVVAAFTRRFPRSVLLSHLQEMTNAAE